MNLKTFERNAIILISVFLVILSTTVLSGGISGHIIGVPSSCISRIHINAPDSIEMYPGESTTFEVEIYNVSCGVSYVRLSLLAFDDGWYEVAPSSIPVIAPRESKYFVVYLDIPGNADLKTYATPYQVRTNQGTFTLGDFELNIVEPEKPKEDISTQISSGDAPEQKSEIMPLSENAKFWYGVAMIASIFAIILVGMEVFGRLESFEEASRSRTGRELSKELGKKPSKEKDFEKTLKKNK